jgi:hypothetical protein
MFVIPLALMECFLFDAARHDVETAWKLVLGLMDEAEANGAVFVVLWHQRMFNSEEFPGYAIVYERLIREGLSRGARFATCGEVHANSVAGGVARVESLAPLPLHAVG